VLETLVVAAWLVPLAFAALILFGFVRSRSFRSAHTAGMIIQITTIGNAETVNGIISDIRAYKLSIPHLIWVVTEPSSPVGYPLADRVIVVPAEFRCRSSFKARALEYCRRIRAEMQVNVPELKILFVDDDSLPSRDYIIKVFHADFDICEGIVMPRNGYGRFLSHLDDMRTLNCIVLCSVFQGLGYPLWVHGEGLCVRSSAEDVVTWDYPMFASEDLVFGHMAREKGLRWGFVWAPVYITSPWTASDLIKQRRRWMWGNVHALLHILPVGSKLLLGAEYLLIGFGSFFAAWVGAALDLLGLIQIPLVVRPLLVFSLVVWLCIFGLSGWMNSGGRARQSATALGLAWITSLCNVAVLLYALLLGNPRRFEVIDKTPRLAGAIPVRTAADRSA